MKSFSIFTLILFFSFNSNILADSMQGTGNNFGSGYRSDGMGGLKGTGDNFGSGWRSDGMGGLKGTGNNFGSGYRKGY